MQATATSSPFAAGLLRAGYQPGHCFHRNARHSLYRGYDLRRQRTVVIKATSGTSPPAEEMLALRHEFDLLRQLQDSNLAHALDLHTYSGGGLAMILEDAGAYDLRHLLRSGPVSLDVFFRTAAQLVELLDTLRRHGLMHRDLSPANLVVGRTGNLTLVDFELATDLESLTAVTDEPLETVGTLAYMSPERSGRTARKVDYRSDVYSVGAICHHLLTGSPPFVTDDPVEMIYSHIARRARSPHEVNPDIPEPLSAICTKLLEKEPESRYQTAWALRRDLAEAERRWRSQGRIAPFPLGRDDVRETLHFTDRLYGRAQELEALRTLFAEAAAGSRRLALIRGPAGIGKSVLVERLQPGVIALRGHFLRGKFDQLRRGQPFASIIEAFDRLPRQLLTLPEDQLARWRERLLGAVGTAGRVLTDLIPSLTPILGELPELPRLSADAARNRFTEALLSFVHVCVSAERPLLLFLDDLQWADAESLRLLERLITDPETSHLLLVLAYRDEEVGPDHPLRLLLGTTGDSGVTPTSIELGPLTQRDIAELLHDALAASRDSVEPLAATLAFASGGNPFALRRILQDLAAERLLSFDRGRRVWNWELNEIQSRAPTRTGAETLLPTLERLPLPTRELLSVAACVGDAVPLSLIAECTGRSATETAEGLWPAVRAGLLHPLGEAYRLPRDGRQLDSHLGQVTAVYRFVHDRIRAAAYRRFDAQRRTRTHLTLGRVLQRSADPLTSFKAADHLNRALELISDPEERLRLAQLDLQVGRRAKAATAYSNALTYFALGMSCLPPEERAWRDHADLTFALARERAECAYLTGDHELAESLMKGALAHAAERNRRAELASVRIVAATLAGRYSHAIRVGAEVLTLFDVTLPSERFEDATRVQLRRVESLLAKVAAEDILAAAPAQETQHLQAMEILANLLAPVFLGEQALLGYVAGKMVELSLENGHSLHSSEAYTAFAFVYGATTGDHSREHELGRVGIELARRYGSSPQLCRALYIFGNHSNHWHDAVATDLPLLRESFRVGIESGELHYASYALSGVLHASAALGRPLVELLSAAEECENFARKAGQPTTVHVSAMYKLHCRALQDDLDDVSWSNHCRSAPDATALCQAHIRMLQRGVLLGDTKSARCAASRAAPLLGAILGMIPTAEYHFYAGLLATSVVRRRPALEITDAAVPSSSVPEGMSERTVIDDAKRLRRACAEARPQLARLTQLAAHCPQNFRHRQMLLQAEIDRLEGRNWRAARQYAAAAERARIQGFEVDHAVADELAGRFFCDHEGWRYAAIHLQAAYDAYRRWGATTKLRLMEESYSHLLEATPGQPGDGSSSGVRRVDTAELLRASQAISGQLALPDLLRTLLEVILRVAGAERAYLILERDGRLQLRAWGPVRDRGIALLREDVRRRRELPHRILDFVHRSKETVVLDDAARSGLFTDDPAVRQRRIRSVLCAPILRQDETVGLLYLENNLTPYAFTPARLETLRHLAAQAAISLENSALVEALQRNQELYSTLAKHFPGGAVYLFDREFRLLVAEGLGLAEAGLKGESMAGRVPRDVFGAEAGARVEALMQVALDGEEARDEIAYRGRVYQVQMAPIHDQRGQVPLGMAMSLDITQRKLDEEQLRLAAKVFESSAEAVVITDAERRVVLVNRSFSLLTGFESREVIGRESELLAPEDPHTRRLLWDGVLRHGHWQGEFWYRHKSGAQVPLWFALTAAYDQEGRLTHYVGIFSDISERKAAEERIQFLAYYDGLTRLPNRALLHERLRLAIALAEREGHRVAVLFLDLDRFKHVNDSLGHAMGDRLLQDVARRLQQLLRQEDTISRFGGDEFVVALSDLEEPLDAAQAAKKILAAFKRPFCLDKHEIRTSTSIGISLYPDDARTPDALIKHADVAMYHAKGHGKNKYQYFTVELNARASERLFIESALARAVSEGELTLHYQAQVDARSGGVIGAEALVRWYHPERGLILPEHFVPLAEETGQVVELGEWALRTACNQNRAWQRAGLPSIAVAVNLGAEHFRQPNFTGSIAAILEQTALSPEWLELELTERTVMANPEATAGTLRALKATGVHVSIDDFGTGYSSLAYLKSFPIDKLKIDQSFIRDVADCADDAVITRSIISLGHNLRLQVVAEGVETPQQLTFLREEDCDALQGFYLSRPLPALEFAQWLSNPECSAILTPPH